MVDRKGLREGCPSSPVLFNSIFHHAMMLTCRRRSEQLASASAGLLGISWNYRVDGHLVRTGRAKHSSRAVRTRVIGDLEFADDTALFGWLDELGHAEKLFMQCLLDWEQEEHSGKREKLIITPGGRIPFEVFNRCETSALKHLGATHRDNADQWAETKKRAQAGIFAVKKCEILVFRHVAWERFRCRSFHRQQT